jgi:hypothetical protein
VALGQPGQGHEEEKDGADRGADDPAARGQRLPVDGSGRAVQRAAGVIERQRHHEQRVGRGQPGRGGTPGARRAALLEGRQMQQQRRHQGRGTRAGQVGRGRRAGPDALGEPHQQPA